MKESYVKGMRVIVKFHSNKDIKSTNRIITRTIGKFGVIDKEFIRNTINEKRPQCGEFWIVEILKEFNIGSEKGLFILLPLKRLEKGAGSVCKLFPGLYTTEYIGKIVIIRPKAGIKGFNGNWIVPLGIKKEIKGIYATICPVDYKSPEEILAEGIFS